MTPVKIKQIKLVKIGSKFFWPVRFLVSLSIHQCSMVLRQNIPSTVRIPKDVQGMNTEEEMEPILSENRVGRGPI